MEQKHSLKQIKQYSCSECSIKTNIQYQHLIFAVPDLPLFIFDTQSKFSESSKFLLSPRSVLEQKAVLEPKFENYLWKCPLVH